MSVISVILLLVLVVFLFFCLKRVVVPLRLASVESPESHTAIENSPEWDSLSGRRQEIESDLLLDEQAKASLIQSWQEMAENSRELLLRQQSKAGLFAGRVPPVLFAAGTLISAVVVLAAIGAIDKENMGWPEWSVDRSPGFAQRNLVTSGDHPGDGASLKERIAGLQARLEASPNDVQGWVLLARTLASVSLYQESYMALQRALALVPGHPGLLADAADMLAMSNNRQLTGEPLELIQQALINDPFHEKALALAATAAEQAGDEKAAQDYWQRLTEAQAENQTESDVILNASVQVPAAALESASTQAVLFVFVKESPAPGMPLAVVRVPGERLSPGTLPLAITPANLIGGKTTTDLPNTLYVQARLAMSGNVTPTPEDWVGQWQSVQPTQGIPQVELSLAPPAAQKEN